MFYWKRNIGDESVLQQGLSLEEVGILTLLEDHFVVAESLTDDWIANRFRIASESLSKNSDIASEDTATRSILRVLSLAFERIEGGWTRKDLAEQVDAFRARSSINKENASRKRDASESQANRKRIASKPITVNRKPIERVVGDKPPQPPKNFVPIEVGISVTEQEFADYLAVRKAKRSPLTATAWERLKKEAELAHLSLGEAVRMCATHGWTSIDHNWESIKSRPMSPDDYAAMWARVAEKREREKREGKKEDAYA